MDRRERASDLEFELAKLRARVCALESAEEEMARVLQMDRALGWGILEGKNLDDTLALCVKAMVEHLGAALARIWLLNEAGDTLELRASAGLYTHLDGPHGRIPVGSFKIGLIAERREPHLTNSVVGDPRVHDQAWAEREGLISFAGYPLFVGEELLGVAAMFARRPLTEFVLQAVSSVSGRIASAVVDFRMQDALLKSEERFRALIEHSSDAIALLDRNATILYASVSTRTVLGYEPEELTGTVAFSFVHPEDEEAARTTLSEVMGHPGQTQAVALRLRHKTRGWLWAECVASNCLEHPHVRAVTVNYRDISERKRAEQELREREKAESLGILASGVAHDFNNLLTEIIGNASLSLSEPDTTASSRRYLGRIVRAAERAAGLTSQMLAYSGKGRISLERVDLSDLIRRAEPTFRKLVPASVCFELDLLPDLPAVEADPFQIKQVLANLVVNAGEAIEGRGCILLRASRYELGLSEGTGLEGLAPNVVYAAIEISDTGCGMEDTIKARIFEPFFSTKFLGRGLGLAAASGIIRAHRGAIRVSSTPGKGSCFQVLLPAAE